MKDKFPEEIVEILEYFQIDELENQQNRKDVSEILNELPNKVLFFPRLEKIEYEDYSELGNSRFGGIPDLPKDVEYPTKEGEYYEFICQINFSKLKFDGYENPIKKGILYMFKGKEYFEDELKVLYYENIKNIEKKYPPLDLSPMGRKPSLGFKILFKLDFMIDEIFLEKLEQIEEDVCDDLHDGLISLNFKDKKFRSQLFSTSMLGQPRSIYLDIKGFSELSNERPFTDEKLEIDYQEKLQEVLNQCTIFDIDPEFRKEHKRVKKKQLLRFDAEKELHFGESKIADCIIGIESLKFLDWMWNDSGYLYVFLPREDLEKGNKKEFYARIWSS